MSRPRASLLVLLCLASLAGCADPAPPPREPGPGTTALELFGLTGDDAPDAPDDDTLTALFGPLATEKERALLRDHLDRLEAAEEPTIDRVQPLEGLDRIAVDLTATLLSGGTAGYSVQLVPEDGDRFRIVWFHGPGVAWPSRRAGRDEGLSTSAPPESPD